MNPKTYLRILACAVLVLTAAANHAAAQARYPVIPKTLADDQETALALSAIPDTMRASASVWTIRDGKAALIKKGPSGVSCMVSRDLHEGSAYPICFDAEGSRTLMQLELMQLRLRMAGKSEAYVDSVTRKQISLGRIPKPRRTTIAYMMSPRQMIFSSPDSAGVKVGAWWPHLMIRGPDIDPAIFGMPASSNLPFSVSSEAGLNTLVVKLPAWSDGTRAY